MTGQLTAQTLLSPGDHGALLQRRAYSYRGDGCLTGAADLLSGPRELTMDPAGRVTAITGPGWAEQYANDPAGNIALAAWPALPGPPAPWQDVQGPREYAGTLLTQAGAVSCQHDRHARVTPWAWPPFLIPTATSAIPLQKLTRSVSGKAARYQALPAWSRTRPRSAT